MARNNRLRLLLRLLRQHLLFFEYCWSSGNDTRVIRFYIGAGLVVLALVWIGIKTEQLPTVLHLLR